MKKILLAAVVAFSSLAANAQIWVGGSLGAEFSKKDVDGAKTESTFTISPEVGYTLSDKWDIAVAINTTLEDNGYENLTTFSVEPYARFTFAQMDNVSFFVDGGFAFGTKDVMNDITGKKDDQTSFKVGVRPGVKFAVNEKLGLVAKLGWLGYETVKDSHDAYGLNVSGAALSFGAYYCF